MVCAFRYYSRASLDGWGESRVLASLTRHLAFDQVKKRVHLKRLLKEGQISTSLDVLRWSGTHENDGRLFTAFALPEPFQTFQPIHAWQQVIKQDEMRDERPHDG